MDATARAKNAALVCCYFARNLANYSAVKYAFPYTTDSFWLAVQGNALDIAVLEWCKLFGNKNGNYHWRKTIAEPEKFRDRMLDAYFSPSWTPFQPDGGRDFSVIVDGISV